MFNMFYSTTTIAKKTKDLSDEEEEDDDQDVDADEIGEELAAAAADV